MCLNAAVVLFCAHFAPAAEELPAAPPPFESVCFDDYDDLKGYPAAEPLQALLVPVPGQPGTIDASRRGSKSICRVSGWHRLKPAWQEDSAWRIGPSEAKELDLHFWAGREGITLRLFQAIGTWAAYKTTRSDTQPKPQTMVLWALDNGKYGRARSGTVEVRCQGGRLVLSRGDLVLLNVPFPALPQEVYLQGTLNLRGMTLLSSGPAPLPAPAKRPVVLRVDKPAEAEWKLAPAETTEGVTFSRLPDGRVELAAAADVKAAQATLHIGNPGLYEYLLEVEDAEPGSGVFFGTEQGEHLFRVAFARLEGSDDRTVFYPCLPSSAEVAKSYNPVYSIAPLAGRRQWLRVVYGAGIARCYTSGDGRQWSEVQANPVHAGGACAAVGLYCSAAKARRAIKLRSLEVRRLDALASLAPAALVERVALPAEMQRPLEWHRYATQSQPADVAPAAWRRACAIRALADNRPHTLGQPVLMWLLDDVLAAPGDWREKLRAIDEAALLVDVGTYGSQPDCPDLAAVYERLGRQLCREGDATPLRTVGAALLATPSWNVRIDPFPQELVHCELLALSQQERWAEVSRCCRRLRYFLRLGDPSYYTPPWKEQAEATLHLLRWAEAQAWLSAPQLPAGLPQGKGALSRRQWRHPLTEHVNKEGFSQLAEFDAAVSSGEYRGACQVAVSWSNAAAGGLLPAANDQRLLQSLSAIMESAMQQAPALRQTMREQFTPMGQLRLKQAIADGDAAAVEAVALQFYGTEAAADAHLWLGDRWLSRGEAARAIGHYRALLSDAPAAERDGVAARLRLAGAMLGRNFGAPTAAAVEFGPVRFTAAEFERLIAQVRRARQENGADAAAPAPEKGTVPFLLAQELGQSLAPGQYTARPWARLDAPRDVGPWGGRYAYAVACGDRLIAGSLAVQAAFDLADGRQKWVHHRPANAKKSPHFVAVPPAVGPDGRLYALRAGESAWELVCLDAADGRKVWTAAPGSGVSVVSEPLLTGRSVVAVCSTPKPDGTLELELASFDLQSGGLLDRAALLELTDFWSGAVPCRMTLADDRIVGTAGGTVFCCDLLGRVAWVRRQIWAPRPDNEEADKAPLWRQHAHEPPLAAGSRVYATQPGVWAVECLDLSTGRLLWRRGLFDATQILGLVQERLIVGTTGGMLALGAETGDILWRHDADGLLDVPRCGGDGRLFYARLPAGGEPRRARQPALVWVDPANGRATAETVLDVELPRGATFGPLVVAGGRSWAFAGSDDQSKDRIVLELTPVAHAKQGD